MTSLKNFILYGLGSLVALIILIYGVECHYKRYERAELIRSLGPSYVELVKAVGDPAVCIGNFDCSEVPCNHRVTYEAIGPGTSHPHIPRSDGMEGRGTPGTLTFIKGNVIRIEYFGSHSVGLGMPDASWTEVTFRNGKVVLLSGDPTSIEGDFANCKCDYFVDTDYKRQCHNWTL